MIVQLPNINMGDNNSIRYSIIAKYYLGDNWFMNCVYQFDCTADVDEWNIWQTVNFRYLGAVTHFPELTRALPV